jgi:uncharacterized RDD family membrane protein YckC
MSRIITVVTPENIQVTYQVAGFASRFIAKVIDLLIQILLIVLTILVLNLIAGQTGHSGINLASIFSAIVLILLFLIIMAYGIFFEMLWGGRTPGKRLFGLRVIREGGYPINFLSSAIRNLLWFIDFGIIPLPGAPLVLGGLPGLLCIFFSPNYKRIGDYAAGTLVIIEAGTTPFSARRASAALSANAVNLLPFVRNLDRLTPEEYRTIRRFTERRFELEMVVQAAIGERLAVPLMQKLEIEAPIRFQLQYADLLEAIERRYAEERGVL